MESHGYLAFFRRSRMSQCDTQKIPSDGVEISAPRCRKHRWKENGAIGHRHLIVDDRYDNWLLLADA